MLRRLNIGRWPPELRLPFAFALVFIGMSYIHQTITDGTSAEGQPVHAWAQIAYLIVAIGLSYLSAQLTKPDDDSLFRDSKPTTLATRGTFLPVLKSRRRVGYIFGWADNRTEHERNAEGSGKGDTFATARETAYNEDAWHLIACGPIKTLWEIDENGTILLRGPITSDVFPSGSTIPFGSHPKEGTFKIYWGEIDQPINTFLGDADRVGVESRFPGLCYIEWRQKALGTQPVWGQITYVIESLPQEQHLTHSPQVVLANKAGFGPNYWQITDLTDVAGNIISIEPYEFHPHIFPLPTPMTAGGDFIDINATFPINLFPASQADGEVKLEWKDNDDPATNKFYLSDFAEIIGDFGTGWTRFHLKAGETIPATVNLIPPSIGGDPIGRIIVMVDGLDSGWNGSHLIASLLFDNWPNGLNLSTAKWDLASFDAFATIVASEELRCSIIATEGKDVRAVLGAVMQDLGVTISMNPRTALLELVPWRLPVAPLPDIPLAAITKRVRKRLSLGPRKVDRLVFKFPDETNSFRDMTIHVDDDGQATLKEFFSQEVANISTTAHFATAASISQRRAAEELSRANTFRVTANRGARALIPGSPITVEGFDEVMRVTSLTFDPLSGEVEIALMNDFYGATLSEFVQARGKQRGSGGVIGPDGSQFLLVELPEELIGSTQTVAMFALRPTQGISGHGLSISRDDTTFTFKAFDSTVVTGGVLDDDLLSTGEWFIDEGPEFTVVGADIGDVLDLSSDTTSWRKGRQMALITDASGNVEIFFLKKVTFIAGDTYRLDGLIRARYDSNPIAVTADANAIPPVPLVVIVQNDEGAPITDVLLDSSVTLYGKAVPTGANIAEVQSNNIFLYGKGIRPLPVTNIRLDTGSSSAGSGNVDWTDFRYKVNGSSPTDDLIFTWGYKTPQSPSTGAGSYPAGNIQLRPAPEGDFVVEILNSSDVLQRTSSTVTNSYTYVRADRIADFSGEPTSFKVRITQTRGGHLADSVTQTITKI